MNNYSFPEEISYVQPYELSYEKKEPFTQPSLGKSIVQASEISTSLRMSDSDFEVFDKAQKGDFNDYRGSYAVDEGFTEPPPLCPVPMLGRQYAMDEKRTVTEVVDTNANDFNIEVFDTEVFAVPATPEKNSFRDESALGGDVGFLLQSMIET